MSRPKNHLRTALRTALRAILVPWTNNAKIGSKRKARRLAKVSTTYASTKTSCPRSCEFFDNGCYGQNGPVGFTERRLSRGAARLASVLTAQQEAAAIDGAFKGNDIPQDGMLGGRDLRLHTVGDASTIKAASLLGGAAARWRLRKGGRVWTYTHAWREVPRAHWGRAVTVLASVVKLSDVAAARAQGYPVARTVARFPMRDGKPLASWIDGGVKHVACPAQTREDTGCADCGICLTDPDKLVKLEIVVTFEAHGAQENKVKRHLDVLNNQPKVAPCAA